mmetsp:Transcript_23105/g.66203  ORF Transcript_23105/g.66203 Transcript_23105/m.66203 type:complete len:376 (+) Transcript_23105:149-1276(+)
MLRRNVRLRKEYLYRKSIEDKERAVSDRKRKLKDALEGGKSIPTELRGADKRLRPTLDLDDDRTMQMRSQIDDEYAYAGVKDPKVLITTARDPSSRLAQFAKELRLLFPTSQRINRGAYILKDLVRLCQTNDVTDLVIVHEHRGEPDGLIVSHLPYGPTAYFGLSEVALRHDLPKKPPNISEVSPHLIFHQFESKLGRRVETILKHLFPPAAPLGQRCMSFINQGDFIHFRHHTWAKAKPGGGEAAAAAAAAGAGKSAGGATVTCYHMRGKPMSVSVSGWGSSSGRHTRIGRGAARPLGERTSGADFAVGARWATHSRSRHSRSAGRTASWAAAPAVAGRRFPPGKDSQTHPRHRRHHPHPRSSSSQGKGCPPSR